jgi:hypothetical protein
VTLNLGVVNDVPVANLQNVVTPEETAANITLSATDPDNDPLTYTVVSQPDHGTLSGTTPNLTYTPNQNYAGTDSFTFKVNDGNDDSLVAGVTILVTNINDAPSFTSTPITTAIERTVYKYEIATTDSDKDDDLTITVTTKPGWLSLIDNGDGTATLGGTPAAADVGSSDVTLRVTDAGGLSSTQTFTIVVEQFTLVVYNGNDNGPGSLREVAGEAVAGSTITFRDVTTVSLTSGEITLDKNITIRGPVTITANNSSRIFVISSGSVTLSDLTLTGGFNNADGGAIYNFGTLTLQGNTRISESSAVNWGGAVYNASGTLTMQDDSSISGNTADLGGGIFSSSPIVLQGNSSISGNTADYGGGVFNYTGGATFTMQDNSRIFNNTANVRGGGVYNLSSPALTGADFDGGGDDNIFGNTPDQVYPQ